MRIFPRRRVFLFVLNGAAMLMTGQVSEAQDRSQGRSMLISRNGIVAAESPLAAQAGARILERGGKAGDAAIATNAMMGVVEPMMNGIVGDLFAIVYDAKANKLYGLNASGWAPKELTIEYLQRQGIRSMPQQGVNAITVPGLWMAGRSWRISLEERNLRRIWRRRFELPRMGFPFRNGRRLTGLRRWITCGPMRRRRRPTFRETARRKWARCFAIPNWHGRWSRSRSTAGRLSTKAKLPRRYWTR